MRGKIGLACVALLLCGVALLVGQWGVAPAGAAPDDEKKDQKVKGPHVCPKYPYAHFGEYCSFYSEQCRFVWVSLDTGCDEYPGNCNGSMTYCVDLGRLKEKERKAPHHHKPDLEKGLKKKEPPDIDPTHMDGKAHTKLLGAPILAELDTGKAKPKVALYLFLVTPKDGPPRIFGNGKEVETKKEPDIKIAAAHVTNKGKVCTVELGSVTYQVILHEKTDTK